MVNEQCDVAIIGAGPAGLSTAINAASEGLTVRVVEPGSIGGQSVWSSAIENLAGWPRGISGATLANREYRQARKFGATFAADRADTFCPANGRTTLQLASGALLECRATVIACGLTPRKLDVPGANSFGVFNGANPATLPRYSGKSVALIGAGNSAGQAAVALLQHGASVTLFARGTLADSMSEYLIDRIKGHATIHETSPVERIDPAAPQVAINGATFDAVFTFIGATPQHTFPVSTDARGFITTDGSFSTSIAGVFAVGDIRAENSAKRIAAAIGEGAAVVPSIHKYLNSQR